MSSGHYSQKVIIVRRSERQTQKCQQVPAYPHSPHYCVYSSLSLPKPLVTPGPTINMEAIAPHKHEVPFAVLLWQMDMLSFLWALESSAMSTYNTASRGLAS